jgi:hypothetical protein
MQSIDLKGCFIWRKKSVDLRAEMVNDRDQLVGSTYLLTPRRRVLLEKLTDFQLVKKFPTFYGTRRFITTFTSARYLSLS